ncbi:cobalamin biosynthesis protein [Methanopyrus sp.]
MYALGVGMRRRVRRRDLVAAVRWGLEEAGELREIITITRKRDQPSGRALIEVGRRFGVPVRFIEEPTGHTPSDSRATDLLGTPGSVCEGVLIAHGYEVVQPKRTFGNTVTAALGWRKSRK